MSPTAAPHEPPRRSFVELVRHEWGALGFVVTVALAAIAVGLSFVLHGGSNLTAPPPPPCPKATATAVGATPTPFNAAYATCPTPTPAVSVAPTAIPKPTTSAKPSATPKPKK